MRKALILRAPLTNKFSQGLVFYSTKTVIGLHVVTLVSEQIVELLKYFVNHLSTTSESDSRSHKATKAAAT